MLMRSLVITLTEPIQDVESGVTVGGPIFLREMIKLVYRGANQLVLVPPVEIRVLVQDSTEIVWLKYEEGADEDALSVSLHASKVSKMEIEF